MVISFYFGCAGSGKSGVHWLQGRQPNLSLDISILLYLERGTRMNPADILKYGHRTVTQTLQGFPEAEWETGGVCGWWSTKDIMAHLASYEHWLQQVLAPFAGVEMEARALRRMAELGDGFNDAEVADRQGKTPAEVVAEYNNTYQHTIDQLLPAIPPEKWRETGTLPWYGSEYSLDDFIVYTFYGHKREHTAQIAVFLDQLKQR
jgi:hypothetical protein